MLPSQNSGCLFKAVRALELAPADCLMIGDSLENDIGPAKKLGMQTFHVRHSIPGQGLNDAARACMQ